MKKVMQGFETDYYRVWVSDDGGSYIIEDRRQPHNAIRVDRGHAHQIAEMLLRLSASLVLTKDAQTRPIPDGVL